MINATEIMRLRSITQMPVSVCKSALEESQGDFQKATEIIRQKTGAVVVPQANGKHGLISIQESENYTCILEVQTQTDFVSRSSLVVAKTNEIARACADEGPKCIADDSLYLNRHMQEIGMQVGEPVYVSRINVLSRSRGNIVSTYLHHDRTIGVILTTKPNDTGSEDSALLRQICMHIAAANPTPIAVHADEIWKTSEKIESEQRYLESKAATSGKSPEIQQRIIKSGLEKFVNDRALLEQMFIIDPKIKVGSLLKHSDVISFLRWQVGEDNSVL
jgi:elongation factor Ts